MSIPLYYPINQLKPIDENIWLVDGDVIHMSFSKVKVPFSTRMTVIKLTNGDIWIHSPVRFDETLAEEILKLGPIKHLVSPNSIHYAYIKEWKERFPEAVAWRSPGVEKRAQSQGIETDFDRDLENHAPSEWAAEIDQIIFQGGRVVQEVVFHHKSSRTLILTDLIENFEPEKTPSRLWRTIHKIAHISAPHGETPIDYRLSFAGNKHLARESLNTILSWEPKRIIIAHGKWFEENAIEELKRAFHWLK